MDRSPAEASDETTALADTLTGSPCGTQPSLPEPRKLQRNKQALL